MGSSLPKIGRTVDESPVVDPLVDLASSNDDVAAKSEAVVTGTMMIASDRPPKVSTLSRLYDSDDDVSEEDHTAVVEPSADSSRLVAMTSRQVPRLLVAPKDIVKLPMDSRAAFLVGHIDGIQTMQEILDVCAMPEADALELIDKLLAMGVIALL